MNKKSYKLLSLEKEFQIVIANYIQYDLVLSELGINIMDVDIDKSLARAIIYYVTQNEKKIDERKLNWKVKEVVVNYFGNKIKRIPNLIFRYDDTYEKGRRVNKIIDNFNKGTEDEL